MNNRRRSILLSLGLIAAATVSLAATVDHWWNHLPNPAVADRDDLFRWLVLRDLHQEPAETRAALLCRLGEEMDQGIDFVLVNEQLGPTERRILLDNVDVLLEDWFYAFAQAFHEARPEERSALIDREIQRVRYWGILEYLSDQNSEPDGKAVTPWKAIQNFNTRALAWAEQAEPASKAELKAFLAAVHARIFAQALESFRR